MNFNWFTNFFRALWNFATSKKAQDAIVTADALTKQALPIIEQIADETGNVGAKASLQDVQNAYNKFGVPLVTSIKDGNETDIGNALTDLAIALLQMALGAAGVNISTTILKSAVMGAYMLFKYNKA